MFGEQTEDERPHEGMLPGNDLTECLRHEINSISSLRESAERLLPGERMHVHIPPCPGCGQPGYTATLVGVAYRGHDRATFVTRTMIPERVQEDRKPSGLPRESGPADPPPGRVPPLAPGQPPPSECS
jgi:hypothetical protein